MAARRARTKREFDALVERGRGDVVERGADIARTVRAVLVALKEVRQRSASMTGPGFAATRDSVTRQLESLLAPGWVRRHAGRLVAAVAEVRAGRSRGGSTARAATSSATDGCRRRSTSTTRELWRLEASAVADIEAVERERLRWMIEEFRLSLFAQELKTLLPVSAKRLDEQFAARAARGPRNRRSGRSCRARR